MNDFTAHFLLTYYYDFSTSNDIMLINHEVIKTKLVVFGFLLDL
jgi:hypothetical protein